MAQEKETPGNDETIENQPSLRDAEILKRHKEKRVGRAPRAKPVSETDPTYLKIDHPNQTVGLILLMDALGTSEPDFVNGLLSHPTGAQNGSDAAAAMNFLLSVIKGGKPADQLEAMLLAQMGVVHKAAMTFAGRLQNAPNVEQQDSAERAFSKLMRTYIGQMEALKRYRSGGEQKVTVQYVNVSDGGQAIVGNGLQSEGVALPKKALNQPLRSADAKMMPAPSSGSSGLKSVSAQRRIKRR